VAEADAGPNVRFELELIGGAFERRYRRLRPEVEEIAWGSLDTSGLDPAVRRDAQTRWTLVAFNEYRTAASMAGLVRSLIEARAPLDLVAYASTFVTDELVHAELAARMAMELGGAAEVLHDPNESFDDVVPAPSSPLLRAAEAVVRVSSVAEVLSSAIGRALWHATTEPLARSVLGRIMRDEFKHAALGTAFLDWADESLSADDRRHLSAAAQSVADAYRRIGELDALGLPPHPANPLAWMSSSACIVVRETAMRDQVITPLARRGIVVC